MRLPLFPIPLLFAALLGAQTPPAPVAIENTGKPMRIPFACTQDDIRAAGLTCPPERPCAVYLELAGFQSIGNTTFLAGNLHTDTATLSSILLTTSDGGKTWHEPYARMRMAGLDLIQFADFETGWISGQALAPLPRDPFLLLTHDGGKTWYSRPVFSESREGAIDYFHFDSKTHGMLWIDRSQSGETGDLYESYESMTGGESWVMRETSGRPLWKGPRPSTTTEWRLEADPSTKSYRVKRRAGAGWGAVAAFVVRAGDCREAEVKLAPEPDAEQPGPGQATPPVPAAPASTQPPGLKNPRP